MEPNSVLLITGYYDPSYRPFNPVRTCQNDAVTDMAQQPTEWMYLKDLLALTEKPV